MTYFLVTFPSGVPRSSAVLVSNFALCACLYIPFHFAQSKLSLVWHRRVITCGGAHLAPSLVSQLKLQFMTRAAPKLSLCLAIPNLETLPRYKHAQIASLVPGQTCGTPLVPSPGHTLRKQFNILTQL